MLTCDSLTCQRGERILFQNLGFSVLPGSVLTLRGPNGSGKTSLLMILAGLLRAEQGSVLWESQPVHWTPEERLGLIYIPHANGLKPEISVIENLFFWASLDNTEIAVPAALTAWGLEDMADTPVYQLSAGYQRRVALARLLLSPRTIWLLDEPTTNLDADGQNILDHIISLRGNQGGIIICSTHHDLGVKNAAALDMGDFTV